MSLSTQNIKDILLRLNSEEFKANVSKRQKISKQLFVEISLHTLGAAPSFKSLSSGAEIKPRNYFGKDYQWRFDEILMSKHPRESVETRNWRYSQYKPLTREPFTQLAENIVGSIFQDNNYSIFIDNEKDRDYILNQNSFEGYDLVSWFSQIGFSQMINDANGYFVRMPNRPFGAKYDKERKIEIYFISGENVIEKTQDYIFFEKDGYVYYIDKVAIWRFKKDQNGNAFLDKEDEQGYYSHLLGRLPLDIAGGFWNEMGYFESFFSKAIPIADEFISSYSAEQLIDKEASHPFIQVTKEECHTCNGKGELSVDCNICNGSQNKDDGSHCSCAYGKNLIVCTSCKGAGTTNLSPGDRFNVPYDQMDKDMVRIISPDVNINTYHNNKNSKLREDIYRALYLTIVGEDQSGVAKALDLERKDLFFSKLINHIFDTLLYNTIRDIIAYRNVATDGQGRIKPLEHTFSITKPKQSRIRTTANLLDDYKSGKDAGLPLIAVNQMFLDYMDKQYSSDPLMMKKVNILAYYDILLCVNAQDRLSKLATNSITQYHLSLSDNLPNILEQLIIEKGQDWFVKISIKDIWQHIEPLLEHRGIARTATITTAYEPE